MHIIIPTYNEEKHIKETVESCIRNNLIPLVIDDNSTDDTVTIAIDAGAIVLIKPQTIPAGKNISIRYGAEQINDEHVIILDADTIILNADDITQKLENGADLVGGIVTIKEDGRLLAHCEAIEYDMSIKRARPWLFEHGYLNNVSGAFFGINRELLLNTEIPEHIMGEDMFLTQIGLKNRWNIELSDSVAITYAIPNIKALLVQRARWTVGWSQVIRATGRYVPLVEMIPVTYRIIATIVGIATLNMVTGGFWISTLIVLGAYFGYEYYRNGNIKDAISMMVYRQLNFIAAIVAPIIGRKWVIKR
jgi:cellulose synthase/poly-beta-1,6-N-acetylglucosamine synthase-like glycosyltransferase